MTNHERNRLESAYQEYIDKEYTHIASFSITASGFCLATLSAQGISSLINIAIVIAFLLSFLFYCVIAITMSDSDLSSMIKHLKSKYKGRRSITKEINTYNFWFGWSARNFKHTLVPNISILFMAYTASEHLIRLSVQYQ